MRRFCSRLTIILRIAVVLYFASPDAIFSSRAASNSGSGEKGISIAFTVRPFLWETYWFRAGIAGLLMAAGWSAARWRSRMSQAARQFEMNMTLAADVAHLGMWQRDIAADRVWMTAKCCELFQLAAEPPLTFGEFLDRVHPED